MNLVRIDRSSGIPLVGCLYFGIIDRGTNLLQVRPSCHCNLACPFCSVDAGPGSRTRASRYEVESEYLLSELQKISAFKGEGVECHIDSPGEPLLYPTLSSLVQAMKQIPQVQVVSIQTNGTLLTAELVRSLEKAGLDRINLSLHALDPDLSRRLAGVPWYDVDQVVEAARTVAQSTIDLLIAPVYLPGLNDEEIPRIIELAQEIGAGKRWPSLGIQKFERYRLGRCPREVQVQTWGKFHQRLQAWEQQSGLRLILTAKDFGIEKRKMLPQVYRKGERTSVTIQAPGWLSGEMLGIGRNRVISVMNCSRNERSVRVRIVSVKHNIYVAVPSSQGW
ncbi:MAG: radical SAM protein [Methanomicrobiales archaeon]|nr:radical SAM protein [Methanomicrobiales archaeon]